MARNQDLDGGPGTELIRKKLRYEMGDINVIDRYLFTLTVGRDLKVHYEGAGTAGDLKFTAAALASAASHIVLSQGNAVSSGSPPDSLPARITADLPPFLLSRAVFTALKEQGQASYKFEWSDDVSEVAVKARKQLTIVVEGKKTTVPVLYCRGSLHDCKLWIIDDDAWPVILKHEEEDGCFWKLLEAGKALVADDDDDF